MSELSEIPSDQSILQEALQEKITFSADNCFSITATGNIPPDTTPKLDANRLINEEEKLSAQFALEMPPVWQTIIEECGQHLVQKAAELGVTIQGIENFYPHFVLKRDNGDIYSREDGFGFANSLSRRPIVFVDSLESEPTFHYIGVIYHEMFHAISRKRVSIQYKPSGEFQSESDLGISVMWNSIYEEFLAHSETDNYLNGVNDLSQVNQTYIEKLRAEVDKKPRPRLNEIRNYDRHGIAELADSIQIHFSGLDSRPHVAVKILDTFVKEVLGILPETERKTVEFLFKKARFAADYKYIDLARSIIQKYWGDSVYNNDIEETEYSGNSISQNLEKLKRIRQSKQSSLTSHEDIPDSLAEFVKQLDTTPPGKQ